MAVRQWSLRPRAKRGGKQSHLSRIVGTRLPRADKSALAMTKKGVVGQPPKGSLYKNEIPCFRDFVVMMFFDMLKLIVVLFLIIQWFAVSPSSAETIVPQINIRADTLEYDIKKEFIFAKGNVVINYAKIKMKADKAEVSIKEKKIHLLGNVEIYREDVKISLSSGVYFGDTDTACGTNATGKISRWSFSTERILSGTFKEQKTKYVCEKSHLTSCDLKEPHYKITSTKMTIIPDEFISVYNAVFYIGKIPVFYLPYWFRGLKKNRLNLTMEPGYNSIDGLILKTLLSYEFSDFLESKLLYDIFSRRGTGKGVEINYNIPSKLKSTLNLYHIKEGTTSLERWRLKSYLWNKISKLWSVHSEVSYISDERFSLSYYGESWYPVEREINTNIFFTRQTDLTNLRVGVARKDKFDITTNQYLQATATTPSIEYLLYKRNRYLGFYPEFRAYYKRTSTGAHSPYLSDFQSKLDITNQLRILRNFTFAPNFGIQSNYSEVVKDKFRLINRYFAGGAIRYSPIRAINLDATHSYIQRTHHNTLIPDPEGIEGNLLNLVSFIYPKSYIQLRCASGYNFLTKKYLPLSNEVSATYKKNTFILRYQQNLELQRYDNSQFFYSYAELLSLNLSHTDIAPQKLDAGISLKIPLSKKTQLAYSLSGSLVKDIFDVLSQQLVIKRDLHCWEGQLTYRSRKIKENTFLDEFFIQLNLKTDIFETERKEIEKELYPWR